MNPSARSAVACLFLLGMVGQVVAQAEPGWKTQPLLRGHTGAVQHISFSPDSRWLFSAGSDGTIRVWDLLEWKEKLQLKKLPAPPLAIVWGPSGKTLGGFCQDGTLKVWDMPALTPRDGLSLRPKKGGPLGYALPALSPDGTMIAAIPSAVQSGVVMFGGGGGGFFVFGNFGGIVIANPAGPVPNAAQEIKVWDAATGKEQRAITVRGAPTLIRFTPDGRALLVGSAQTTEVRVHSVATGREQHILKHRNLASALGTPDGKHILTGGLDDLIANTGTIKVWDRETGKEVAVMAEPDGAVTDMALAPDGKLLASVANFRAVHLWDAQRAREVGTVTKDAGRVEHLVFSPDGSMLAAVRDAVGIQVWRAEPKR